MNPPTKHTFAELKVPMWRRRLERKAAIGGRQGQTDADSQVKDPKGPRGPGGKRQKTQQEKQNTCQLQKHKQKQADRRWWLVGPDCQAPLSNKEIRAPANYSRA
ncbi:hypothetical protein MY3296_000267 [Beauveria thailandica]